MVGLPGKGHREYSKVTGVLLELGLGSYRREHYCSLVIPQFSKCAKDYIYLQNYFRGLLAKNV